MNFIAKIRTLEANGYGVWKSHIKKKWENDENRRKVELRSVEKYMKKVARCENPAIARAFTRMIDHQGLNVKVTGFHTEVQMLYTLWFYPKENTFSVALIPEVTQSSS